MDLYSDIIEIKGIGEKSAKAFKKLNIENVRDLIFYIPRGFTLFESPVIPTTEMNGEEISIAVYMHMSSYSSVKKGNLTYSHINCFCEGIQIRLSIFNMPYLKKQLNSESLYIIRGMLEVSKNGLMSMSQPKIYTKEQYEAIEGTLQPLYPLTKGLTNNAISKAVKQVINSVEIPDDGMDDLKEGSISFADAITNMHFPMNYNAFILARERIVFHEFLSFILQMKTNANSTKNIVLDNPLIDTAETARLIESLPYRLTNAQLKTWNDIKTDMTSNICMNRMVQGDVGSGKTILAFLALLLNATNAHQGVLMAPTEVLAKQHYENLKKLIKAYKLPLSPVLILGSMSAKEKRAVYDLIENGLCNVIIGTHAVFQNQVKYKDLTLVVTDEQHRFGVKQRESIVEKGNKVHLLVMSATPIPRSLAMIMYGDVSLSIINEMPSNRLPIKNCVVGTSSRDTSYNFIANQIKEGHQAYVICPQVEEGIDDKLENVIDYSKKIAAKLPPNVIVSYLHGKMSLAQKNEIMDAFKDHKIDVLVSTTVIEVGIDVPNATVIMIENSERFGLAQLHQLRGRVGRGDFQSYCIFISSKTDQKTMERLDVLNKTNDGFKIADEDLRMRGPGDLFGIRQSGEFGFEIADIYNDSSILREASVVADSLLSSDTKDQLEFILSRIEATSFNTVDFRTI